MKRRIKSHADIPKRSKNAIDRRTNTMIEKYGLDAVRLETAQVFKKHVDKRKLEAEIKTKEAELARLKKK